MKTVQFFIDDQGVSEVFSDPKNNFTCTCLGFETRKRCKHVAWCESKLTIAGYPVLVEGKAEQEEIEIARSSDEEFRKFLLKYGKVEAI